MMDTPFFIDLPTDQWVELIQPNFQNAVDGAKMTQQTFVKLKHNTDHLSIAFECHQDPYWQQSTLKEHNSDLWSQEVFELFIAQGTTTPTRYLEIEINPNNALFVGWVDNPTKEGDAMTLSMVPYEKAGIVHHISHTTPDSWCGELHIPLALLRAIPSHPSSYRLNFYRIIQLAPQADPNWVCSVENASFQCWSSTMSGTPPRFHRPDAFGTLLLK